MLTIKFIQLFLKLSHHQLEVIIGGTGQGLHPHLKGLLGVGCQDIGPATTSMEHQLEGVLVLTLGQFCQSFRFSALILYYLFHLPSRQIAYTMVLDHTDVASPCC